MLTLLPIGPLQVVRDTRACSLQENRCLLPGEAEMLAAFDEPAAIGKALAKLAANPCFASINPRAVFEDLVSWGYLLPDERRALSLVTNPTRRVLNERDYLRYPGGWLGDAPQPGNPLNECSVDVVAG